VCVGAPYFASLLGRNAAALFQLWSAHLFALQQGWVCRWNTKHLFHLHQYSRLGILQQSLLPFWFSCVLTAAASKQLLAVQICSYGGGCCAH
jgi:hypothetical protein